MLHSLVKIFQISIQDDDVDHIPTNANEERPSLLIQTNFPEWCEASFAKPLVQKREETDPNSEIFVQNQERISQYTMHSNTARATLTKRAHEIIDSQICCMKNPRRPIQVGFHPFDRLLYILDETQCHIWDYSSTQRVHSFSCCENRGLTRHSILLNPHFRPFLCAVNTDAEVIVFSFLNFSYQTILLTKTTAIFSGSCFLATIYYLLQYQSLLTFRTESQL